MLQVGQGPQPQFVLTAGAADPVRHQPGFRLPPGKGGGNYGGALREYVRTGGRIDADRDIASLRSVNVAVASYDHITGTVTVDGAIDINALM